MDGGEDLGRWKAPRTMRSVVWAGLAVALLALGAPAPARAQYALRMSTPGGGGGESTGGAGYRVRGTVGQSCAGTIGGGIQQLKAGLWRGGITVVGVEPDAGTMAALSFRLLPPAPNPVARGTVLAFELPAARFVRLQVLDVAGRVARTLVEGPLAPGRHSQAWDGTDDGGRPLPAGVYFLRLDSAEGYATRKVVVAR